MDDASKGPEAPRDLKRGPQATRFVKHIVFDAMQNAMFVQARAKLQAELGRPVTDDDVIGEAIRLVLSRSADGSVPGRRLDDASLFRVEVKGDSDASEPAVEAARSPAAPPPRLRRYVPGRDGPPVRRPERLSARRPPPGAGR